MEKNILMGRLLDIYGELLPQKQKVLIDLACNKDLSLSEISETQGITRQGVHDSIRRGELQLSAYEDSLHLLKEKEERVNLLHQLQTQIIEAGRLLEVDSVAVQENLEMACGLIISLLQKEE